MNNFLNHFMLKNIRDKKSIFINKLIFINVVRLNLLYFTNCNLTLSKAQ